MYYIDWYLALTVRVAIA